MTILFDKRLAELDAYLQMLIQQAETLEDKLKLTSTNNSEKDGLLLIKNNLESLLGSIKHAIVLLQIAKVSIKIPSPSNYSNTPLSSISRISNTDNKSLEASTTEAITASLQEQQKQLNQGSPKPPARAFRRNAQQQSQRHLKSDQSSSSSSSPASHKLQKSISLQIEQHSPFQWVQQKKEQAVDNENRSIHNYGELSSRASDRYACLAHESTKNSDYIDSSITRDGASVGNNLAEDDDEDAFYDAADEQEHKFYIPNATNLIIQDLDSKDNYKQPNSIDDSTEMSSNGNIDSNQQQLEDGSSIDWDALYEEEEEDLGSLENEGSVIKHLISQIRIGMDLTKVVLPTFILERRSLLEMYADFFAHPDLFSSIPDYETPEERMVQLVRWYLSAFHAGRKSSVAKKPYNPILGEIFICHWNLNDANNKSQTNERNELLNSPKYIQRTNSTESRSSVSDIEKFSKKLPQDSLLFVAEQVSHHPPVSAFYAENSEKRISCCSYIYTKSKYLGLSVGVHNIGQGVISLLKHNETYVCTFPSAYGRSILTVPWVELGGSVNINCKQSGYSASIEFVTKPFYGGKKHRVIGEILRPNKEPFITIDGEWNGRMYSKSPPNSNERQVFVDTTCVPVIKKHVRSISSQESFESRNVWKEVTRALKLRDVSSATAAKSFIEQKQRDLLKDRMEKGIKWKARYFETVDDGWTYAKPLADRLTDTN